MQRLFDRKAGPGALPVDVRAFGASLAFPSGAGDRPYTWVNMIVSLDGKAVFGPPGTTWTVGSTLDHLVFKELRRHADAVLTGAGVMIADDIPYPRIDPAEEARRVAAGLRPYPLWVIVSGRAQLPETLRVYRGGRENVLVVVTDSAPVEDRRRLEAHAQVLVMPGESLDMAAVGRLLLSRYGIHRLYSIGGPTLNGTMLATGTLDEIFFTLAPKLHGGSGMATMVEGPPPEALQDALLLSLHQDGDELFLRYAVSPYARAVHQAV